MFIINVSPGECKGWAPQMAARCLPQKSGTPCCARPPHWTGALFCMKILFICPGMRYNIPTMYPGGAAYGEDPPRDHGPGISHLSACQKVQNRLPFRAVHHAPAPGDGVLRRAAAAGAPAGHHALSGYPAAVRRHGPALRRADQPHHPQKGGVPVHRLCGLGNGRQLRPPGRKAAGAHRRPAGRAAAGPRHPQRPVSAGVCGQ